MEASNVKHEAERLLAELPQNATWEDLMYRIYVREAIEAGLEDSDAERTDDVGQVREKYGLSP